MNGINSICFQAVCILSAKNSVPAQEKGPFLDLARERDDPIPLYKTFSEIFSENWWMFATLGALALLFFFAWWLVGRLSKAKTKEEASVPRRDPYEEAIKALGDLDRERNRMEAKPFVFRLSEILRVYVERRFGVPAMEQTGEEFLREVADHKFFHNRYDDLLREFIDRSDIVKFSKENIDGEGLRLLMKSALHFVKDTHRRLEEERAQPESQPVEAA